MRRTAVVLPEEDLLRLPGAQPALNCAPSWPPPARAQVLLGSDYPFDMGSDDPVDEVQAAGFTPTDEAKVLAGNAAALGITAAAALRRPPHSLRNTHMVKIARWNHDGGTQSGFVDDGACYALPAAQTVQTPAGRRTWRRRWTLPGGLSAPARRFRWRTCSCSPRWCRPPSATSSPSRSTSRGCARASTASPAWCPNGTRRPRSTSPTRTR